MTSEREGWSWLSNSTKWHYFVGARSLCLNWAILGPGELEQGGDDSKDNCVECKRRLAKRRAKEQKDG